MAMLGEDGYLIVRQLPRQETRAEMEERLRYRRRDIVPGFHLHRPHAELGTIDVRASMPRF